MKKTLFTFTAATLLGAALVTVPAATRAADAGTNAPSAAMDAPAPVRFNGSVTAVDTNAMTFTINDQTYTVTGDSHIMRNGQAATLADVVVGDPVRGSYTKGTDGKLDVNRVRFGKPAKKKKSAEGDASSPAATPPASPQQ